MTSTTIDLTRESPPVEPVPVVEERPQKKKKRQLIVEHSSEATESDQPSTSVDEEIEIDNLEKHESVTEVTTQSAHPFESVQ
jgi:hypothetical protein